MSEKKVKESVNSSPDATKENNYRLPSDISLKHAAKLSIVEDKPILLDYWTASLDKKALVGARDNGEKLLVKSEEEYTFPKKRHAVKKNNKKTRRFIGRNSPCIRTRGWSWPQALVHASGGGEDHKSIYK